ncbi:MAG: hypothetical protein EBR01_03420 [Proteobacteria bacterium]|nr:hypothetical protein [Pseudomonadota bacterium]
MRNDKFLVELINNLTKKDLFIGTWLFGAALFSYLMWSYSKKANQRNFRSDDKPKKKMGHHMVSEKKPNNASKLPKV